ncbi:g protein alpha i subunit [Anaeramoeba ignava]|uniref:G protein alpha i subunit n=1 Tax=Anaeramoeba ignava TaxID=1746090 RepID=A0A9Q0LDI1_ANAIG|nr:g protein alpha i subunit [Anaeramoeba ignava]
MGIRLSKKKNKESKENQRNKQIEQFMRTEEDAQSKEIKILVLGAGDSGKTTLLKQMSILYQGGISPKEIQKYKRAIRANVIGYILTLIKAANDLQLDLLKENQRSIIKLWSDPSLKSAFEFRSKFQLADFAAYYLNNTAKIADPDYSPSNQDILNCRIPTTGVNVINFEVDKFNWRVVDVGGQRSERRKWIHQFDNVSVLIYVVAISEYDQKLFEDVTVNRMHESLSLFKKMVNNEFFKGTNVILMFNKIDLFEDKIKKIPLKNYFPDFDGEDDIVAAKEYFKQKFLNIGSNPKRHIFVHFACAIDTDNMKTVFEAIRSIVTENQLKKEGFIQNNNI